MNSAAAVKAIKNVSQQRSVMTPRLFTIEDTIWETGAGDVFTWRLSADDQGGLRFKPGQFNMLYIYGVGEVPISISSAMPAQGSNQKDFFIEHTIRAAGSVTQAMQKLKPGQKVGLRGPFGSAWPLGYASGRNKNTDLLIIAGGIGLAPLRPLIYHALDQSERYDQVRLLYGTRTPLDIIYRGELENWQQQKSLDVHITVDRAASSWRGHVGVVTHLINDLPAASNFNPKNTDAVVCGPETMMNFAKQALCKVGLDSQHIFLSMERNMRCALGHCGHCQLGPYFICKDGPVFRLDKIEHVFQVPEL